ncbi:CPBP family intramembrane metalloprotease [Myxococcus sp. K15C18031901]|uniref:CPBP family glutamic-type intramembrane protease n=1 Tax=Myxococcus dinghuensis TaxID=2906761 RepID=UPI0020A8012B|nr:CPBP family glutamic-type intramembrane protease [Myxococcus dinghuensis]MCP3103436.1 CPBP family intramembrane metalloprotease [Myxococcus dinghuensis]
MEDSSASGPPPSEPPGPSEPPPGPEPMSPRAMALGGGALALALFLVVGGSVQLLNAAFGIWFTELFIFLALAWLLPRIGRWKPALYMGLKPVPAEATALGFFLGVANFIALVVPIQFVAQRLAPESLREMFDGARLFERQTPLELGIILAGVTVAAPICEELFFRGIFQRGLTPPAPHSPMRALVFSAVVFSAFHLDPVGFTARVELGLLFGWLYLRTGSVWPGIAAHAANNLVSSVLFLAAKAMGTEAGDADADTNPLFVLGLSVVGCVAMLGLFAYARHSRVLDSTPGRASDEEARETGRVPSVATLLLPWVVTATVSLGLLVAVDRRGIALNLFDTFNPLPALKDDAPSALQAERKALDELRASARRGQASMETYQEERLRQARDHLKAGGTRAPP